ncbi:MAG: hypothetical protein IKS23_05740 [Alphaproteobacteria bacterium]|nr:hypothetical protein [Alphaproteobacteria bacterium]
MDKFFIKKEALKIRPASLMLRLPNTLEAIKITEAEAMVFKDYLYRSFDDALAHFGAERKLSFGDVYKGYLVIWHTNIAEVNYMEKGRIVLETNIHALHGESRYHVRNGCYISDYMKVEGGNLFYVWTPYCSSGEIICKDKIAEALKEKRPVIELEYDEIENLKTYLGVKYFYRFFIKI